MELETTLNYTLFGKESAIHSHRVPTILQQAYILQLPSEILNLIFSQLDSFDRLSIGQVNRRFRRIIHGKGYAFRRVAIKGAERPNFVWIEITFPNGDRLTRYFAQDYHDHVCSVCDKENFRGECDLDEETIKQHLLQFERVSSFSERYRVNDYSHASKSLRTKHVFGTVTNIASEILEDIFSNSMKIDEIHIGMKEYMETLGKRCKPKMVKSLAAPLGPRLAQKCDHLGVSHLTVVKPHNATFGEMEKCRKLWLDLIKVPTLQSIHSYYTNCYLTCGEIYTSNLTSIVLAVDTNAAAATLFLDLLIGWHNATRPLKFLKMQLKLWARKIISDERFATLNIVQFPEEVLMVGFKNINFNNAMNESGVPSLYPQHITYLQNVNGKFGLVTTDMNTIAFCEIPDGIL